MPSTRNTFRLREAVKHEEGELQKQQENAISRLNPLAVLGKPRESLTTGVISQFDLQTNSLEAAEGQERTATALCPIAAGTLCSIQRYSGRGGGVSSFWGALPCSASSQNAGTFTCPFAEGGEMPQVTLTITGLVDNAAYPEFDGWAAKIARTDPWELRHDHFQIANTFPESLLGLVDQPPGKVSPCQPGLEWSNVPDDKNGQTASGPFGVRLTSIVSGVGVLEVPAAIHLEFYAGAIDNAFEPRPIRLFWREGVGANRFPRDANGKGQYDQTYALWVKPSSIAVAINERFRAWLNAATITLN